MIVVVAMITRPAMPVPMLMPLPKTALMPFVAASRIRV